MINRTEQGSTLIEVLVATVVLALTATAILTMLTTSISSSAVHRSLSETNSLLADFSEAATYDIDLANPSVYLDCNVVPTGYLNAGESTVVGWYNQSISIGSTVPTGYSVKVVSVAAWNTATNSFSGCSAGVSNSVGLQQLTITATAPDSQSQTLTIVVRTPADSDANAAF